MQAKKQSDAGEVYLRRDVPSKVGVDFLKRGGGRE